jgi:hypothetical protein
MTDSRQFRPGDLVLHPRRPEWGDGVVDEASPVVTPEGKGQRLVIRFQNHGRVTINTSVAPLVSKESVNAMSSTSTTYSSSTGQGWLGALSKNSRSDHELHRLPDPMTDPFQSLARRLEATVESFKFSTEARSLIDWAVAQTGLNDPLSKYTRHELELGFARFARDRELHLRDLVKQLRSQGKLAVAEEVARTAKIATGRAALQKAIRG